MSNSTERRKSPRLKDMDFDTNIGSIFENVFDLYGTLDPDGRILSLTGSIFLSTNTNPELLKGQLFAETVFWQSSENTPKIIENAIDKAVNGEHAKLLIDFRVRADEKRPVEMHLQRIESNSGESQVFICAQLISERTLQIDRFKQESEQLLFAAENADIGLWFWDYVDNRIYSTPQCNELFEIPAYEICRYERFRQSIHPDDRDFVDEFLSQSRVEGTRYEEEFRVVYSDGTIEWLCAEGKSFLDEDGNPQRMMGVIRKITEQKLSAAELEKVYEREKKALDAAVEANRAKDFFLAFVSHELRSPLNAILGWSKILLTKEVDEETRVTALETIERSARVQTKLINDLVDSARVASGRIRLEYSPVNLFEIVKNSFEAQKPAAENRQLAFTFTSSNNNIPVFGDAARLQQVFANLISNSIKFTPEGGSVSLDIQTTAQTAIITTTDTGVGISRASLPDIFKQFSQGDADNAKANASLGLGLSIVNILVTKHGGTVEAQSDGVGKGAKFTVILPLRTVDAAASPEIHRSEPATRRTLDDIKILIVEDDDDSREVLQLVLQQSGAFVTAVGSAKSAMTILTGFGNTLPDIIISDIGMPDEDGYAFVARLRKLDDRAVATLPAMALSAFATADSKDKAFEAGFDHYSTKPFEADLLIKDVTDLLARKASQKDS